MAIPIPITAIIPPQIRLSQTLSAAFVFLLINKVPTASTSHQIQVPVKTPPNQSQTTWNV